MWKMCSIWDLEMVKESVAVLQHIFKLDNLLIQWQLPFIYHVWKIWLLNFMAVLHPESKGTCFDNNY